MQPNEPFSPQPVQPTPAYAQPPQQASGKKHRKLALLLLIGPSALFVVALFVSIVASRLFPDLPPAPGEVFGRDNPAKSISNIFVFLSGAVVILTWLPGIIIGSILLSRK